MKKQPVGLVVEGSSTSSTLLRLSSISSELGPIKSLGLQVARRVSNFLKGGYAVTSYSELVSARTILIRVPDCVIQRIVDELCNAELTLAEHSFILCETWAPTEMLMPLQSRGAHIASMVLLPTGQDKTFAIEGDPAAVRQIRRIVERDNVKTLELRSGSKHLLFAAAILCSAIPVPILLLAQQAMRDGGVSGNQLAGVIQEMSGEMLAGVLKGARNTWGGPLADSMPASQETYWQKLSETNAELAQTLTEMVAWSRDYMSRR